MCDLILLIPDHCLSIYFQHGLLSCNVFKWQGGVSVRLLFTFDTVTLRYCQPMQIVCS